jgi:hypothetical protein
MFHAENPTPSSSSSGDIIISPEDVKIFEKCDERETTNEFGEASSSATIKPSEDSESLHQNDEEENDFTAAEEQPPKKLPAIIRAILAEEWTPDKFLAHQFGNLRLLKSNQFFVSEPAAICPQLLVWDCLVRFLSELDALTRVDYCEAIDLKLASCVLERIVTLLPESPGTGIFEKKVLYFHRPLF